MKQKIFEVGKKAYTFNQARYEEDMGRCVITAVSERYITDDILDYLTERTYAGDGLQETNLTGLKFTLKGVDYEVLEHTKDKYRVLMLNRKAISK